MSDPISYEHDIFLSYAHGEVWSPYVKNVFLVRLHGYLENEIGGLNIFVDDQIQSGARWDNVLRRKLARSKLLVAMMSAEYFRRPYCRLEMALMLERERALKLDCLGENYGLMIPIRLGDGDSFPDLATKVQYHDLADFADPDISPGTARASAFNDSIRKLAKTIAATLPSVPGECDSKWADFTGGDLLAGLAPKPLAPKFPPRLLV